MISAGDHERLPDDSSQEGETYDLTETDKKIEFNQGHLDKLRKGVNIGKKSKVVDNLIGKTMEDYNNSLSQRAKGKLPKPAQNKRNEGVPHPNSPIRGRTNPKRTLPGNIPKMKPVDIMTNKPAVANNDDISKVFKMALDGKSGFKMTNRLKNKIGK